MVNNYRSNFYNLFIKNTFKKLNKILKIYK